MRVEPPTRTTSSICSGFELGVLERVDHRLAALLGQRGDQLLELAAGDRHLQVLGSALVGGDERQVHGGFHGGRKLDLGLLGGFLEALEGHRVLAEVDAFLLAELLGEVVDELLVEVVAAEVGVAVDGEHFEDAIADVEDGDVERAAAEVEDADLLVLLFVHAVGEGGGGGFGEDAQHLEAGDFAGVLGGLALGVVEVGRDGDDGFGDFFAEVIFGGLLEVLEDEGRDLLGRVFLAANLDLDEIFRAAGDLVGDHLFFLATSLCRRPMKRLMEKTVFLGLVTCWCLAV